MKRFPENKRVKFSKIPGLILPLSILLLLITTEVSGEYSPPAGKIDEIAVKDVFSLTAGETEDSQPAVVTDRHGITWAAWIGYEEGKGDKVRYCRLPVADPSTAGELTAEFGDYFKPSLLFDKENRLWVFWGAGKKGKIDIYCRVREKNRWSETRRLTDNPGRDYNQSVCLQPGGKIYMAWESFVDGSNGIYLALVNLDGLGPAVRLSSSSGSARDPVLAADSRGLLWTAWCEATDRNYEIYLRSLDRGKPGDKINLSRNRNFYDLHPSLAIDGEDNVWVAWDSIFISEHGETGNTKIRRPVSTAGELPEVKQRISLIRYDGTDFSVPVSENPEKGITLPSLELSHHGGFPRIAADGDGRLWAVYRAWHHTPYPENYYWTVAGQVYSGRQWSRPVMIPDSSGPLEPAAITVTGDDGLRLAWTSDAKETFHGWVVREKNPERPVRKPGDWSTMGRDNSDILTAELRPTNPAAGKLIPIVRPRVVPDDTGPRTPSPLDRENPYVSGEEHYRIKIGDADYRLYWGNLHSHSNVSRCMIGKEPGIRDYYSYMRDICLYDFCALTDHAEHINLYKWWKIGKLADFFNIPGSFTTLLGYEWSSSKGHKNVIFPERGEPICSAVRAGTGTPDKLWDVLKDHNALTIPHHPAADNLSTDWSYHNEKFQRLVEIFQSCRGSYEYEGCPRQPSSLTPEATRKGYFVQDALNRGHKLGFVCSSDHGYGAVYTAVLAPRLDRESIFDGLYQRRCYGSTEKGIILDFRADGHIMGEEYQTNHPPRFQVRVIGTTELSRVDLFKDGSIIYSSPISKAMTGNKRRKNIRIEWNQIPRSWEGKLILSQGRIIQAFAGRDYELEPRLISERELNWVSGTPNRWSSTMNIIVEAPDDARITIALPGYKKSFSVKEIMTEEIIADIDPGKLLLTGGDIPMKSMGVSRIQFEFSDNKVSPGTSWYYLRVIQTNGEMAWSSPIWVTYQNNDRHGKIFDLGYIK